MQNTLQNVFDQTRGLLQGGDTSAAFGLSNAVLQVSFNLAYPEMWQAMASVGTPRVRRRFYYVVPAYTTQVSPVSIGVTDMAEPGLIGERGSLTSVAITGTNTASPIQVTTSAPHGQATNSDVTIDGVSGTQSPWGRWFVTVNGASTLTLNGSASDGVAGTGGTLVTSAETRFLPVNGIDYLPDRQPYNRLQNYLWEESVLRFRGATADAQIRVEYWASATPPTVLSTVLGIDDCEAYLSTRMANLVARGRGWYELSAQYEASALGPKALADGTGGLLHGFLVTQVKRMQATRHVKPPYRGPGQDYPWPDGKYF